MSIKLVNTNSSLVAVLSAAVASVEASILVCGQDHVVGTSSTEFSQESTSNGASEVTILAAPAASTYRSINYISIYNGDTNSITITIKKKVSSTYTTLCKQTIDPGATLEYTNGGWRILNITYPNSYRLRQITKYTSTGANTWTKPSWCRAVRVRVQAGGGGSAYQYATTGKGCVTPGGGGGGYTEKFILSASLGATETATVGAGGVGGTSGSVNGGTGGTSSFGSHCSATGGAGAVPGADSTVSSSTGAAGGTATGGDINIAGSYSDLVIYGVTSGATSLPNGGDSFLGGSVTYRVAGQNYGSGGGLSFVAGPDSHDGYAGGPGIIIVEEYE